MKTTTRKILDELFVRYPKLKSNETDIEKAFNFIKDCFERGGTLFLCGNGGSSSDCEHIAGELLKSFKKKRAIDEGVYERLKEYGSDGELLREKLEGGLPVVSLVSQTGIITAFANDKSWEATFAQQLYATAKEDDCLLSLSTSGNSKNCVFASVVARAKKLSTVALTGEGGGKLKEVCDCVVAVPERETYLVQELHLPLYHALCAMLEEEFF